jgi:hypothetical protein
MRRNSRNVPPIKAPSTYTQKVIPGGNETSTTFRDLHIKKMRKDIAERSKMEK